MSVFNALALLAVLAGPVPLVRASLLQWSPGGPVATRATAGITVWIALQVGLAQLLGALAQLRLWSLLAGELVLAALGAMWTRRLGAARRAIGDQVTPPAPAAPSRIPTAAGPTWEAAAVWGALVPVLGLAIWRLLVVPTSNFDSLHYHLPSIGHWMSAGRLAEVHWLGAARYYPYGWELLSLVLVLPCAQDVAIAMPNVLAWILLGLATFALARSLGASQLAAPVASALVLLTPTILGRLDACQPDLALAALFVAGLHLGWRAARDGVPGAWPYAATAAAMLPALKLSGAAYVVVLGAAIAWAWLSGPRVGWRRARWTTVVLSAGLVFLASFWYVRNLILNGNPLGSVAVRLAGRTLFDGFVDPADIRRTTLSAVFEPFSLHDWNILRAVLWRNLGFPMLAVVVLAVLGLLMRRTARGDRDDASPARGGHPRAMLGLVLLVLATAWIYVLTPYSGDNGDHGFHFTPWAGVGLRYADPLWALLGVLAAVTAPAAAVRSIGVVAVLVAAVLGLGGSLAQSEAAAIWLPLGGTILAVLVVWSRRPRSVPAGRSARRVAIGLALGLFALLVLVAAPERAAMRPRIYGEAFARLETDVAPRESIAFLAIHKPYPLYGSRLSRTVIAPEQLSAGEGVYGRAFVDALPGIGAWIDRLPHENVRYLAVGMADSSEGCERCNAILSDVLAARRGLWELLWSTTDKSAMRLYRAAQDR